MINNPREKTTFVEWAFWAQVAANIVALGIVIAVMFQVNNDSARRTQVQTKANREVILELVDDLGIHGQADTNRTCAIAREFRFFVRLSPEIKPHVTAKVNEFTKEACLFVSPDGG